MHFVHCEICFHFRNVCVLDREVELFSFIFCNYIKSVPPIFSQTDTLRYLLINKQLIKQLNYVQLI